MNRHTICYNSVSTYLVINQGIISCLVTRLNPGLYIAQSNVSS